MLVYQIFCVLQGFFEELQQLDFGHSCLWPRWRDRPLTMEVALGLGRVAAMVGLGCGDGGEMARGSGR